MVADKQKTRLIVTVNRIKNIRKILKPSRQSVYKVLGVASDGGSVDVIQKNATTVNRTRSTRGRQFSSSSLIILVNELETEILCKLLRMKIIKIANSVIPTNILVIIITSNMSIPTFSDEEASIDL